MTTQNSRIKYFIPKCHVSQAALSSNWGRTSVLPEGLHTTPPNFHVYDCCQNCCAYTENFFIKHYYTILWVFYEPIWSRPNILIFLRLLKTQISKKEKLHEIVPQRFPSGALGWPSIHPTVIVISVVSMKPLNKPLQQSKY